MKHKLLLSALGTGVIGLLAGCANTTNVEGAPSPSVNVGDNARWSANIQSVTQNRGDVAQSTRDRSYGSATWTQGQGPTLSNVNLVFTYAGQERSLNWAIITGSCGTQALSLLPMSNFPELQIAGGGRATVTTSLPVALPINGTYHIDIYRSRQQSLEALVACGNLKLAGN